MEILDWSQKELISEDDLRHVAAGTRIRIRRGVLITPLAKDVASGRGIQLDAGSPEIHHVPSIPVRRVAIGSDHGGFPLKEALKPFLAGMGCDVQDVGTDSADPVDYPDFAHRVALKVVRGHCQVGIMIDAAGIGSCMAANKVPGIRAALCHDEASAINSREHNGANVLTLAGKTLPVERAQAVVRAWLGTGLTEERHRRRVLKISGIEQNPFG